MPVGGMRTPAKRRATFERGYFAEKQARSLFVSDATASTFRLTGAWDSRKFAQPMLRTLFIGVFLSLYILVVGPALLVYTLITAILIRFTGQA